jgi:hypothetical protein
MEAHKYEVWLKNVPVGTVDADFQRWCQAICDIHQSPSNSKTDRFRNAWQVLVEGSPVQANETMKVIYGENLSSRMLGNYIINMVEARQLEKLGRGHYRYVGLPTINT